jgi:hypothetical protein
VLPTFNRIIVAIFLAYRLVPSHWLVIYAALHHIFDMFGEDVFNTFQPNSLVFVLSFVGCSQPAH